MEHLPQGLWTSPSLVFLNSSDLHLLSLRPSHPGPHRHTEPVYLGKRTFKLPTPPPATNPHSPPSLIPLLPPEPHCHLLVSTLYLLNAASSFLPSVLTNPPFPIPGIILPGSLTLLPPPSFTCVFSFYWSIKYIQKSTQITDVSQNNHIPITSIPLMLPSNCFPPVPRLK